MTIDYDQLALEVMSGISDGAASETLADLSIEFARHYRAALKETMEPVATKQLPDPYDERDGSWLSLADKERLFLLPPGTKLYSLEDF